MMNNLRRLAWRLASQFRRLARAYRRNGARLARRQGSIRVPSTSKNLRIHAGWAG